MNQFDSASCLLTEGKIEDAYMAFLSIVKLAAEQLNQVKFSNQHIVNRPLEYQTSIDLMQKSVDKLQNILVYKPPIPPRPTKMDTADLKQTKGDSTSFMDDDDEEDEMVDLTDEFLKLPRLKKKSTTMENILFETVIDPTKLVPAQTHTESLSIPVSVATNYIPSIPVPPLLTIHRQLQDKDDALLPKIRSLYMSAMTIPTMMEFPASLLAYQLTLIESAIFRAIPSEALLTHSARQPHPCVVASTDFFNFLTRTIEHSILLPQESYKRAEILNRWIKVASKLHALSNYQTLKAVVSALGTPPLQRLRRTWECIPKKQTHRLEILTALMSESDNYRQYRQREILNHRPTIPFLGVFIHDLTYMSTAGHARIQETLHELERFQCLPEYPPQPPSSFVIKRQLFRSANVLHFSSKGTTSAAACMVSERQSEETAIGLEQQLIMQYILMRPWVSEKTIDMLSQLREPPKRRLSVSPVHRWDESDDTKKSLSGFWPFKKSTTTDWNPEDEDSSQTLLNPKKLTFSKKSQHNRSFSLPPKSLMDV